jgi:hypothetical protein
MRARVLLLPLLFAACGHAASGRAVSVRMAGGPPEATVTIDDVIVGRLDVVQARGVAVSPGKHRISVEAEGYLPWDKIVEAADAPLRLDVRLVKVPD